MNSQCLSAPLQANGLATFYPEHIDGMYDLGGPSSPVTHVRIELVDIVTGEVVDSGSATNGLIPGMGNRFINLTSLSGNEILGGENQSPDRYGAREGKLGNDCKDGCDDWVSIPYVTNVSLMRQHLFQFKLGEENRNLKIDDISSSGFSTRAGFGHSSHSEGRYVDFRYTKLYKEENSDLYFNASALVTSRVDAQSVAGLLNSLGDRILEVKSVFSTMDRSEFSPFYSEVKNTCLSSGYMLSDYVKYENGHKHHLHIKFNPMNYSDGKITKRSEKVFNRLDTDANRIRINDGKEIVNITLDDSKHKVLSLSHGRVTNSIGIRAGAPESLFLREDKLHWVVVNSSGSLFKVNFSTGKITVDTDSYIKSHEMIKKMTNVGTYEKASKVLNDYLNNVSFKILTKDSLGCGEKIIASNFLEPLKQITKHNLIAYPESITGGGVFSWSAKLNAEQREPIKNIGLVSVICPLKHNESDCLVNKEVIKYPTLYMSLFKFRDKTEPSLAGHPYLSFFDSIAIGPEIGIIEGLVSTPKVATLYVKASQARKFTEVEVFAKRAPLRHMVQCPKSESRNAYSTSSLKYAEDAQYFVRCDDPERFGYGAGFICVSEDVVPLGFTSKYGKPNDLGTYYYLFDPPDKSGECFTTLSNAGTDKASYYLLD